MNILLKEYRAVALRVLGASFMLLCAGTTNADSIPGCGNGFELHYAPEVEAFIGEATQGNVNGDGYICVNSSPNEHGQPFAIIIDNKRQSGNKPH